MRAAFIIAVPQIIPILVTAIADATKLMKMPLRVPRQNAIVQRSVDEQSINVILFLLLALITWAN